MPLKQFTGIQSASSFTEKLVSGAGALLSISLVFYLSHMATSFQGAIAILPSMGASAVLLFAVPHGTLSQPWPLFVGNLLSAIIGVACYKLIGNIYLAAGSAVGIAIFVMHLTRSIHPPGGATALAAVIGGPDVAELGFHYVWLPTALNCLVIFFVAVLFNNLFAWRRYPSSLMRYQRVTDNPETRKIHDHHIQQAMATLDEVIDIAPEQIKYIVDKADEIMRQQLVANFQLEVGAFYTNGKAGLGWSVRQVVDTQPSDNPSHYQIIYRTVEGQNKNQSGTASLVDFANWAAQKIQPADKNVRDENKKGAKDK